MTSIDYRKRLQSLMLETLADEAAHHDWTYWATRPRAMPARPWHTNQRITGDCSKGVQFLCWWAESPHDPMGMHYGAYGNSATMAAHLTHLSSASQLLIGDIVTFGNWGSSHAAMVLVRGADPLLWSFGHQGAPNQYRLSQDRRVHQYLRNPIEAYLPTTADRLRAKTGYWSWLQWRLGEGYWSHYPPLVKTVRPDVPALIPAAWWRNFRRFLANRQQGNETQVSTPTH